MTAADPRDGLQGLVANWRTEAAICGIGGTRAAYKACADELEAALAHARPEAVDDLRNKVAIAALQGLLSNPGGPVQANASTGTGFCNCNAEEVAGWALDIANAMIATLTPERAP